MKEILPGREVIFEFSVYGAYVRVRAMDTASLTEITISGPKTATEDMLKINALKRLAYVMKKKGILP